MCPPPHLVRLCACVCIASSVHFSYLFHIYVRIYKYMCTYYIYTYICTYIYTYIYIYICIYIFIFFLMFLKYGMLATVLHPTFLRIPIYCWTYFIAYLINPSSYLAVYYSTWMFHFFFDFFLWVFLRAPLGYITSNIDLVLPTFWHFFLAPAARFEIFKFRITEFANTIIRVLLFRVACEILIRSDLFDVYRYLGGMWNELLTSRTIVFLTD